MRRLGSGITSPPAGRSRLQGCIPPPVAPVTTINSFTPAASLTNSTTATVTFSAPIAMSAAQAIRIQTADGKQIAPVFDKDDLKKATIEEITFKSPLPPATAAKLILPAGIKDESGALSAMGLSRKFVPGGGAPGGTAGGGPGAGGWAGGGASAAGGTKSGRI